MSALRLAELLLVRVKDRIKENHTEMDKGKPFDQYNRLVGKNQELKWIQAEVGDFLRKVEGEELDEL